MEGDNDATTPPRPDSEIDPIDAAARRDRVVGGQEEVGVGVLASNASGVVARAVKPSDEQYRC
jgi:hypothetical protein